MASQNAEEHLPNRSSSSLANTPLTSSADSNLPQAIDRSTRHSHGIQHGQGRRISGLDYHTRLVREAIAAGRPNSVPAYTIPPRPQYNPPQMVSSNTLRMEPPRLGPRSQSSSAGSTVSSRSSFESRTKSPLSITSSIDYDSDRTSFESVSSNGNNKSKLVVHQVSEVPIRPTLRSAGRRNLTEPNVPTFDLYDATGNGRQQTRLSTSQQECGDISRGLSPYGMQYTRRIPGEGFRKLSEKKLLGLILAQLRNLHLDCGSLSCSTCYMRDLLNVGRSCKKWWETVHVALYEDIQLNGSDSVYRTKKLFSKLRANNGTRLTLLRRTLRDRSDLAAVVKYLKVPALLETTKPKEREIYQELIASLVMACPNLERLSGIYPAYNHDFSRLDHALSTRTKLAEKVWIVNRSPFQRQHRFQISADSDNLTPILAPAELLPEQCITFREHHANWPHLRTLVLQCRPGGTIDSALFTDVLHSLPALENLHVSGFPPSSFNDATLNSLRLIKLKSLRLESLPGITASGLSSYASADRTEPLQNENGIYPTKRTRDSLTSLSLVSLPMLSLPVLARLFSHLKSLQRFTISQAASPSLLIGVDVFFLHPYLASSTLKYLHWEFTNPDDDQASQILAKAILYNGFPSLQTLRAPTDHDGLLQDLCKPRHYIELPSDRYRDVGIMGMVNSLPPPTQSLPGVSPTQSTFSWHGKSSSTNSVLTKSPTRSAFSLNTDRRSSVSDDSLPREPGMSLVIARRMAQRRLEAARNAAKFHIIEWDDGGALQRRQTVGFLGMVESQINYTLKPDVDGMEESVVGIDGPGGLLDKTDELNVRDGCTGSWNLEAALRVKSASKGKEQWSHTERGRCNDLRLEKLF